MDKNNSEWLFDGTATEIIIMVVTGIAGIAWYLIRRESKTDRNESENIVDDNMKCNR